MTKVVWTKNVIPFNFHRFRCKQILKMKITITLTLWNWKMILLHKFFFYKIYTQYHNINRLCNICTCSIYWISLWTFVLNVKSIFVVDFTSLWKIASKISIINNVLSIRWFLKLFILWDVFIKCRLDQNNNLPFGIAVTENCTCICNEKWEKYYRI